MFVLTSLKLSLTVSQPCTFIAATYVLLGRLAKYLRADKYLFIRPNRVSVIFVLADVVTFLIQVRAAASERTA